MLHSKGRVDGGMDAAEKNAKSKHTSQKWRALPRLSQTSQTRPQLTKQSTHCPLQAHVQRDGRRQGVEGARIASSTKTPFQSWTTRHARTRRPPPTPRREKQATLMKKRFIPHHSATRRKNIETNPPTPHTQKHKKVQTKSKPLHLSHAPTRRARHAQIWPNIENNAPYKIAHRWRAANIVG